MFPHVTHCYMFAWVKIQLIPLKTITDRWKTIDSTYKSFWGANPSHSSILRAKWDFQRVNPPTRPQHHVVLESWKFVCSGEPAQNTESEVQLGGLVTPLCLIYGGQHLITQISPGRWAVSSHHWFSGFSVGTWNKNLPNWLVAIPFLADLCWLKISGVHLNKGMSWDSTKFQIKSLEAKELTSWTSWPSWQTSLVQ